MAVVILTVDYGHPPWIALLLACSFGTYGLAKKKAGVGAVESLTFETVLLAPIALAFILWLAATGSSNFGCPRLGPQPAADDHRPHHGGPADLLRRCGDPDPDDHARAAAVPRAHLAVRPRPGRLRRAMTAVKWVGFTLVWLALAIFTGEALRHRRRQLQLVVEASAV